MSRILGLNYIKNYINDDTQNQILNYIDSEEWSGELKRRVQHYGYKYDYKNRAIDKKMFIREIPNWIKPLCNKFLSDSIIDFMPDQIIVNEYQPGQGIANHIDCEPCFTDKILSLSLGSPCVMDIINKYNPENTIKLLLEPGSLLILSKDARYVYKHGIAARKSDVYKGTKFMRNRRVSLTFRKVILK